VGGLSTFSNNKASNQRMKLIQRKTMHALLRPREASTHKGDYGHALLIAGSLGYMGAACIAAMACLRSGVGLLTLNVPKEERLIIQIKVPEAMVAARSAAVANLNTYDAIGIGPGIGTAPASYKLLQYVLKHVQKPLLLDADALNLIASDKKLLKQLPIDCVLTPHPKEFDRLFGIHESVEQRMKAAIEMAKKYRCVIVLKGHRTLVTYEGMAFVNTTGNAGLAKAGSGDCLSGMITALLAQGYAPHAAACIAVYLHGLAADITLKEQSMESMLISDVIAHLGKAFIQTMK
jgi:NAD(P)H-hydrate epimerase